jgi:secondary thiamine-phosphate synthase enzyme
MQQVINLETSTKLEFIDITAKVKQIVAASGIKSGIASVFATHTTTAIRINEKEQMLLDDLRAFLESIAPQLKPYRHDDFDKRKNVPEFEPGNAHSHLKAFLLGTSESVPVADGSLQLGKWQSILFVELDGPRKRKVIVSVMGK